MENSQPGHRALPIALTKKQHTCSLPTLPTETEGMESRSLSPRPQDRAVRQLLLLTGDILADDSSWYALGK